MGPTQSQGPLEREGEAAESEKEMGHWGWSDAIIGFEGGGGPGAQELGQSLKAEKGTEMDFPPPPLGMQLCRDPDVSTRIPITLR